VNEGEIDVVRNYSGSRLHVVENTGDYFARGAGITRDSMPRRGIRTLFRGVQFRSRHEACFAAFFDELKWKWSYEPVDLAGYIPDFDLLFKRTPLLVEIKPLDEDIEAAKAKLLRSGWEGDAAILVSGETKFVGELFEAVLGWDRAVLTFCLACQTPTIVSEGGRWACRNCPGGNRDLWWAWDGAEQWHAAQNATQWRPT
jgi:hypothetical protein